MNVVPKMWKGTLVLVHRDLAADGRFGALQRRLKFWFSVDLAVSGGAETLRRRFSESLAGSPGREGIITLEISYRFGQVFHAIVQMISRER
jgi:hypothetical protein